MLTAYNEKQERVLARNAHKDASYYCPVCHEQLILKQGNKNIAHFAHGRQCAHHANGETLLHCKLKLLLFHIMSNYDNDVQLEPYLSDIQQIPDIVVGKYAIEVQLSPLPIQQMHKRTEGLVRAGYRVIWLTTLPRYRHGVYYLNQLQQNCIDPLHCEMYGIHPINYQLYRLNNMVSLTARQFHADCEPIAYEQLLSDDIRNSVGMITVRKLATARIMQYLVQCRRKRSVHDPVLSLVYQMKLTEAQVIQLTGFIFPEQIHVYTHPVLWQLKVFEALRYQRDPCHVLARCIKLRQFAIGNYSSLEIITQLVERYRKIIKL
ncbi:competence protein CoiA [Staphylococcus muscae]|uniref:Competence protein CoiA n=1 Tax=Staphylococcus muscae TaxID=1294 RepID=A0A240BZB6_9STAP|nr:competence protein CoiA family protein [Staphylococcus muscae]AVQ34520.1 competence protein CoiA [Staphylococcus muscae]PNZ04992.1 competence protein CoiA [Staphylococcus muscae]GGA90976.1 competence protein CoiA [Staphylococcus muscae]SNW01127.1 transcription factor [Staphylococcus muscae]